MTFIPSCINIQTQRTCSETNTLAHILFLLINTHTHTYCQCKTGHYDNGPPTPFTSVYPNISQHIEKFRMKRSFSQTVHKRGKKLYKVLTTQRSQNPSKNQDRHHCINSSFGTGFVLVGGNIIII
jgi:hypothetical protein